jgi:hypothetical protein
MSMSQVWRDLDRPAIGFDDSSELVQRAVAVQIINELPAQITLQETVWAPRDQDFAAATGRPAISTTIKPVLPSNVYLGHRLSLQDAPQDALPAITVRCLNTAPTEDRNQLDQYDSNDLTLIVEVWVSTGPYKDPVANQADSEEIDRQLHRMAAAVRGCIVQDRSFGNTQMGTSRPPRSVASLPFVRKATDSNTGPKFLVQAMELTYTITTLSYG